ncbi:MAG: efflux RND transporter periplasmic adaptor subunit [Planctomycetota bacterium]
MSETGSGSVPAKGSSRSSAAMVVASALGGAVVAAVIVVAIFVLVIGVGGGPPPQGGPGMDMSQGPPPALVELAQASEQDVRRQAEVTGRLEAVRRAVVASEVEGKVTGVVVEVGASVTGGASELATVDDVWSRLDVERAEADVVAAEADLRNSELDLERLERLAASQAARPREVDETRAEVASREAQVLALRAALAREREALSRATIKAPFDGWVTAKHVEEGEWVEPGASVVSLVSRGEIDARLDVPERLINEVTDGATVSVLVEALGLEAEGVVVSVTPDGSGAARTFPVEVRLDDRSGALKPGMSVTGGVSVGDALPRLTVPRDAVQFGPAGAVVWVAGPIEMPGPFAGAAVPVPVTVVTGVRDRFAVEPMAMGEESLLVDGAAVVVAGAERLMPGQPLMTGGPPPGDMPPGPQAQADDDAGASASAGGE